MFWEPKPVRGGAGVPGFVTGVPTDDALLDEEFMENAEISDSEPEPDDAVVAGVPGTLGRLIPSRSPSRSTIGSASSSAHGKKLRGAMYASIRMM